MAMRGVGVTQAALQVRSVAEVPDELRRVASGRAPCRRDSGEEISVGGDEGVGVRREGIEQRPGSVRRDLLRKGEHGSAPSRADVAQRVHGRKSRGDIAARERGCRGNPTRTAAAERQGELHARSVIQRSEVVGDLEGMPHQDVERGGRPGLVLRNDRALDVGQAGEHAMASEEREDLHVREGVMKL